MNPSNPCANAGVKLACAPGCSLGTEFAQQPREQPHRAAAWRQPHAHCALRRRQQRVERGAGNIHAQRAHAVAVFQLVGAGMVEQAQLAAFHIHRPAMIHRKLHATLQRREQDVGGHIEAAHMGAGVGQPNGR
jgi:hypothetical protein